MKHAKLKLLTGGLLIGAFYIAVKCPCDVYLECHRWQYIALLAGAAVPAFVHFGAR